MISMNQRENILLIGSGGREHAIAWKLAQSSNVEHIYVSPGNAGTDLEYKVTNEVINIKESSEVVDWCKSHKIDFVVVGPEDPLAAGIADTLENAGICCFGPSAKAAQIEANKSFAKQFMDNHCIPTARWKSFTDCEKACQYILEADFPALVVKASGLAAGKGVIVAENKTRACEAVKEILQDKRFGLAGETVIVEELLIGEEFSCLAFSDGKTIACCPPAQDHKRLCDGDTGPNTGGMGAYCPCPQISQRWIEYINQDILQKTVDGLREDGIPYIGVLYAGLMLTDNGPKVLEFNCRLGDPETQVILPLIRSDLHSVMKSCTKGTLSENMPTFYTDMTCVAVVLASEGYPGSYKKGLDISGIKTVNDALVFHAGTATKDGQIITSGGRVLSVVSVDKSVHKAVQQAQRAASKIHFDGAFYRRDIALKALHTTKIQNMSYQDAGVDIGAGERLIQAIKPLAKSTSRQGCAVDLGMFGALFDLKACGYSDPILVSGADGVGTKLKIAQACGIHGTIGIDLVAMCVNDVLAHGAEPLFFLDYLSCGKLDVEVAKNIIVGIADGCKQAGCALVGGETAEMPGMYADGSYDLAGFCVGAVERSSLLPLTSQVAVGDIVIGLPSSGIHSNGFSLVRKIVEKHGMKYSDVCPFESGKLLGESLLVPTKIYSKLVEPVLKWCKGFAHITGGGLVDNIPRIMPTHMAVNINANNWKIQPLFGWLATMGNVNSMEMAKTFNCGIGGVLIVSPEHVDTVMSQLTQSGETCCRIGDVVDRIEGEDRVVIQNLEVALKTGFIPCMNTPINGIKQKSRVAVLISGTGTNLQALIDHTIDPSISSLAEIVMVISNVPGVQGLERAVNAGIPTKVISHKDYRSRVEFDSVISAQLEEVGTEIICLAGFMRILSGEFVRKWNGRLLNIHPSLLPSFKGMNAHKMVLEAGVRLTGCSVHFVAEEVDAGAILAQEAVPVEWSDTVKTLSERVKIAEHIAYPKALEIVASGKAKLGENGQIIWNM